MNKLLFFIAFLFIFSASCKSSDLPTVPKIESWELKPVIFRYFTVKHLNVFIYPNLIEIDKQIARLGKKVFVGHNRSKGLQDTIPLAFYLENTNSIHYVEGEGRFSCEHEFEHAQESLIWDNSLIEVNEVCF